MKIYLFLFCTLFIMEPRCVYMRKMILERVENCNKNYKYPLKLNVKLHQGAEMVHLDANVSTSIPFGNNLKYNCSLYVARERGDEFVKVFQIKGTNPCSAANTYMGQFWYDIERSAHIVQVGYCPIPKGQYIIKEHAIDLNRLTFQTIPSGILKLSCFVLDVKTNSVASCLNSIINVQ